MLQDQKRVKQPFQMIVLMRKLPTTVILLKLSEYNFSHTVPIHSYPANPLNKQKLNKIYFSAETQNSLEKAALSSNLYSLYSFEIVQI